MTSSAPVSLPLTTTPVAVALGCGRGQLDKLIRAGLLAVIGYHGKSRLLDPNAVAALAAVPFIAPPQPGAALRGLIVHTDGLAKDTDSSNARPYAGWSVPGSAGYPSITSAERQKAWGAWWNTGRALAADAIGLVLLQSTSGWIGEVGVITHAHPHPTRPGFWFETVPAPHDVAAQYAGHRLRASPGAPWERL